MLDHLVLLKPKESTNPESIQEIINSLIDLKNKIPEIKEISSGIDISNRCKGYTVGLKVTFEKESDLEIYQHHPAHVQVLETLILPRVIDVMAIDYIF